MFTGLVEEIGTVTTSQREDGGLRLGIDAPSLAPALTLGESISVNGVCQTVVVRSSTTFDLISVEETLSKTTLGSFRKGDKVNLERAATLATRLGGHIVTGHVDEVGILERITTLEGRREFFFRLSSGAMRYAAAVGSITVNGVSLTIAGSTDSVVKVAIIPHTYTHTTFHLLHEGDGVNIEMDILAKYVARLLGNGDAIHLPEHFSTLSNV